MDSDSELDVTVSSELDMVKDQLATYQTLNTDLSKKVQEFKINFNAANKELLKTRNELMLEKLKSSELRRTLLMINGQMSQFLNGYITSMQSCIDTTDLEVTLPCQLSNEKSPQLIERNGVENQSAMSFRPASKTQEQVPFDTSRVNLLHTICEENSEENVLSRFSVNDPVVASTPFLPIIQKKSIYQSKQMSNLLIIEQSNQDLVEPAENIQPNETSFASLSSPEQDSMCETITEPMPARCFSQETLPEPETFIETETSHTENIQASTVETLAKIKTCSVDVKRIKPNASLMERYKQSYGDKDADNSTNEAESTNFSDTEFNDEETIIPGAIIGSESDLLLSPSKTFHRKKFKSVETAAKMCDDSSHDDNSCSALSITSSTNSISQLNLTKKKDEESDRTSSSSGSQKDKEVSSCSYSDEAPSASSTLLKRQRKRKEKESSDDGDSDDTSSSAVLRTRKKRVKEILPRRSSGRPKRKSRAIISSLAEKSLRTKLRRSK